jgi:hypothetical protein
MKKHSAFPKGGLRAFLWGLYKRLSGENVLPAKAHPEQPAFKAWIVYTPGLPGVIMGPVQAKPDEVNDNPLGCEK